MSPTSRRHLFASLLPLASASVALVLAASGTLLAPRGPLGDPWLFAGTAALVAVGSLHRPLGGSSLGLGAVAVPPAVVVLGPLPAALAAAAGLFASELGRRLLERISPDPPPERRRLLRSFEAAAAGSLAALAFGSAWQQTAPATLSAGDPGLYDAAAAALASYLLMAALLRFADHQLHRPHQRPDLLTMLLPLSLDFAALGVGLAMALVAVRAGLVVTGVLLASLGLLTLEGLRNAHLLEVAHQRVADLEQINRAGQRMSASGDDLAALAERVHGECASVVPAAWFQLQLADDAGGGSWFAGPDGRLREGTPQPPETPPALPGIHRRPAWRRFELPLAAGGRRLAQLRLWCDPRRIEATAETLLDDLVPQLAASVHRTVLDREARRDPLTGVAARRELEQRLLVAHDRCLEYGGAMAVVLCDLDHFKRINDTYGHGAGDSALVAVARTLASCIGDDDLCCRYGGEEFLLLLEGNDGPTALGVAERVRREVEQLQVVDDGKLIPLTVSAGVAAFPDLYVQGPQELLVLADAALYEAKRQGRNRCLLADGRGRFRSHTGEVFTAPDAPDAPAPPRLFA